MARESELYTPSGEGVTSSQLVKVIGLIPNGWACVSGSLHIQEYQVDGALPGVVLNVSGNEPHGSDAGRGMGNYSINWCQGKGCKMDPGAGFCRYLPNTPEAKVRELRERGGPPHFGRLLAGAGDEIRFPCGVFF